MGVALLTALGGFAEAFVNPAALGLVLALAFLLAAHAAWPLRLGGALVGAATALPGMDPARAPLEAALAGLGAAAAGLLFAEVALHFVLPGCRLALRLLRSGVRLATAGLARLAPPGAPGRPERKRPRALDREP